MGSTTPSQNGLKGNITTGTKTLTEMGGEKADTGSTVQTDTRHLRKFRLYLTRGGPEERRRTTYRIGTEQHKKNLTITREVHKKAHCPGRIKRIF